MVKEHTVKGLYFRTFLNDEQLHFHVTWSKTGFGDWKKWPGIFRKEEKSITVLNKIARILLGEM